MHWKKVMDVWMNEWTERRRFDCWTNEGVERYCLIAKSSRRLGYFKWERSNIISYEIIFKKFWFSNQWTGSKNIMNKFIYKIKILKFGLSVIKFNWFCNYFWQMAYYRAAASSPGEVNCVLIQNHYIVYVRSLWRWMRKDKANDPCLSSMRKTVRRKITASFAAINDISDLHILHKR